MSIINLGSINLDNQEIGIITDSNEFASYEKYFVKITDFLSSSSSIDRGRFQGSLATRIHMIATNTPEQNMTYRIEQELSEFYLELKEKELTTDKNIFIYLYVVNNRYGIFIYTSFVQFVNEIVLPTKSNDIIESSELYQVIPFDNKIAFTVKRAVISSMAIDSTEFIQQLQDEFSQKYTYEPKNEEKETYFSRKKKLRFLR